MSNLEALNKSETILKEVERVAYQRRFKHALEKINKIDKDKFINSNQGVKNDMIRLVMDKDIEYYKLFISELVVKFNESLIDAEAWKNKAIKTQTND